MKRYAVLGIMLALVVAGAYWSGYAVGSRDVKIEYVVREKEVIKLSLIHISEPTRH